MQHNGHPLSSRSPPAANTKSIQQQNSTQSHDQSHDQSQNEQDSDDGNQLQSADENDLDQDDQDVTRLGKRKRPISVS
ncbi:fungal specific transcription factor [Colletotrichum higginsianum]|nr:fungal specific transcription factor [Colletotrichum higginsianum]